MSPDQFEQLKTVLSSTVKETVNGKIDRLQVNQIAMDIKLDNYIREDNEWKSKAQPVLEIGSNIRGFGKVVAYALGIAAALFTIFKYPFK